MNTKNTPRKATTEEEIKSPQWQETTVFCKANQPALQLVHQHAHSKPNVSCKCTSCSASAQKGSGCSPGWKAARSTLLPTFYSYCTLHPNSKQQLQLSLMWQGTGAEPWRKTEVWERQIAATTSDSCWLAEGLPGTCCGLNNSSHKAWNTWL